MMDVERISEVEFDILDKTTSILFVAYRAFNG